MAGAGGGERVLLDAAGRHAHLAAPLMDLTEQLAIQECGNCHRSEREHQGGDPETLAVLEALGGACTHFAVSRAALEKVKRQARAPRMAPICQRCGGRGHERPNCPW